eukprot:764328-Hanusia_phi.AAC.2
MGRRGAISFHRGKPFQRPYPVQLDADVAVRSLEAEQRPARPLQAHSDVWRRPCERQTGRAHGKRAGRERRAGRRDGSMLRPSAVQPSLAAEWLRIPPRALKPGSREG